MVLNESSLDAKLGKCVLEQVVSTAVEGGRCHDVVACLCDVEYCEGLCCLARCQKQSRGAAFKGGNALFGDILRRVHDSGVDVAELG